MDTGAELLLQSTPIQDKLTALKNLKKPVSLKLLLSLYIQAPNICYIDHFKGFKLLHEWLSPLRIPAHTPRQIHRVFLTYEVQEIAKHLSLSQSLIYDTFLEIYNERSNIY